MVSWNKKKVFWRKKIENTKICCYLDLNFNANSLNETDLLNQMRIFIHFWKLETENSLLHVFSFLHKLSFENIFCFLSILYCKISFLVSKIENYFWKQKIKGKSSYQTYPYSLSLVFYSALMWETASLARFIGCWTKLMWMGGVMLLPLKIEVQLIIFSPLD